MTIAEMIATVDQAAAEIDRLRERNAALENALRDLWALELERMTNRPAFEKRSLRNILDVIDARALLAPAAKEE